MRRIARHLYRLAAGAAVVAALGMYGCGDGGGGKQTATETTTTLVTLDAPAGSLVAAGTAPDGAARYDLTLDDVSETAGIGEESGRSASVWP